MSAYVVMIWDRTTGPEQMSIYAKQALFARDDHMINYDVLVRCQTAC